MAGLSLQAKFYSLLYCSRLAHEGVSRENGSLVPWKNTGTIKQRGTVSHFSQLCGEENSEVITTSRSPLFFYPPHQQGPFFLTKCSLEEQFCHLKRPAEGLKLAFKWQQWLLYYNTQPFLVLYIKDI